MKRSLRIASAALAAALAAGCALPAFGATRPDFQKDETVYAVLNADGSVQSTTVSEHLYCADGLAGVQDQSTLTNIRNTQSDAAFVQEGSVLHWDTGDTDVYYKGDTDRALPISASVVYTLDGVTAPLEELLGKSGHLTITVTLTNHETGTVTVDGAERTVCTPLIAAVGVILDSGASNVNAVHGILESAANSSVAAFACLPGVRDALEGLLPDALSGAEDYLQDSVTVEADVENLTAPGILIACAASTEELGTDSVFDFASLDGLTDGMEQLNGAMSQLLEGAEQLSEGAAQLTGGTLALLDGAGQLHSGAAALDDGLTELTGGLDTLRSNNDALNAGAQQIADGVLASANQTLMEGGLISAPMTWENYSAVLDQVLTLDNTTLAAGRKKMVYTIRQQAPSFQDSQLDLALYLAATRTDGDLEAALQLMDRRDPAMLRGMAQMSTDPEAQQKIHDVLYAQVAASQDIADVRALQENLDQIRYFVASVGQYTGGVAAAAEGARQAREGSAQLAAGAAGLYDGAAALNGGAGQLSAGTVQLSDGLTQFSEEGISPLTGALDADQLHTLRAVLDEMDRRLEGYTSFAGAPEGAVSKVKFVYKTGETPEPAASVSDAPAEAARPQGNFLVRLWQKFLALFRF